MRNGPASVNPAIDAPQRRCIPKYLRTMESIDLSIALLKGNGETLDFEFLY
jgi:hypothetical protein